MADDDDKRKRFLEDDDDDAPPPRPKRRGGDGPPVLFLVGLVAGVLAVTGCCGAGGWWVFANVLRGGSGGGWSLFGGNDLEITQGGRTPGFGFNAGPQVSWTARIKSAPPKGSHHYVVMTCGGVTDVTPIEVPPLPGATISQSMGHPALRNTAGPIDIWIERRADPNKTGTRVSNTVTIR